MHTISKADLQTDNIESNRQTLLLSGKNTEDGPKYTTYYTIEIYHVPELSSPFVTRKGSINGSTYFGPFKTAGAAIRKANKLRESNHGFELTQVHNPYKNNVNIAEKF